MTNKAIQALKTIAAFPITDPKNMDALNIRKIAVSALAGLKNEVLKSEKEDQSGFKTRIEKSVLNCIIDVTGLENPEFVKLESKLKEDLDLDDLDTIELHMRLEETFYHEISDEQMEKFKTVKDIVDFVEKEEAH